MAFALLVASGPQAARVPEPAPQRFQQEVSARYGTAQGLPAGGVSLVVGTPNGGVRAFADDRWYDFADPRWVETPGGPRAIEGRFMCPLEGDRWAEVPVGGAEVRHVLWSGGKGWVATRRGVFEVSSGQPARLISPAVEVWQLAVAREGVLYAAAAPGLFQRTAEADWQRVEVPDGQGRMWGTSDVRGVAVDGRDRLWFASPAGVACREGERWRFFEGRDGLPYNDFTGLAVGPDDTIWFATRLGAVRWDGRSWQYRQGYRWLPHDEVRQVHVDGQGRAWFATGGGIGRIERRPMTLAEKAEHYNEQIDRYIKRTPFGFVAEAHLRERGDLSSAELHDSDNDGLWTSMYGAAQAFACAATGDPKARARARQAFEALRFLQKVTQGGTPSPPNGYVARTIRSVELPDPNVGRLEQDRQHRERQDRLWKVYEPRWPRSADGRWYWKSDTSSDELDGHYFFYPLYYDFCADTEDEKARVREVVRDLTDHLLAHDHALVDHDGTPTRWGVYSPKALNHDPAWWYERGLKSLSMLSYLASAAHVTGDPRYEAAARELIDRHGYVHNAMVAKIQQGMGSGNQSDDEMAFMGYYNLLRYTKDAKLKELIRYSFFGYWALEQPEMNPFFNFAYAAHNLGARGELVFGQFDLSPWEGWFEDAMATLYGFPLDRVDWGLRNSHRLDIVRLPPQQSVDLYEPRRNRGHRVNGKVLEVENRYFGHWNTDPWALDYRGNGHELGAGTVFLLPYNLGLYHGYIQKP